MSIAELIQRRRPVPLPAPSERRRRREAFGITQQEIGQEVGVAGPTVARWESGAREPKGERRRSYAAVLEELAERERSARAC